MRNQDIFEAAQPKRRQTSMQPNISSEAQRLVKQYDYNNLRPAFLSKETRQLLSDVFAEWEHREILQKANLPIRNKFLLHGPSGNGKTSVARRFAQNTKLPLYEVETALIIASHLGETEKHVSNVLTGITTPCVVLWDEIDSILMSRGSGRSSTSDVMDRSVNVFLTCFERLSPNVLFFGLTNRQDELDVAALRRFDVVHEVPLPDLEAKQLYIKRFYSDNKIPATLSNEQIEFVLHNCRSYAEMEKEMIEIARQYVLAGIPKGKAPKSEPAMA